MEGGKEVLGIVFGRYMAGWRVPLWQWHDGSFKVSLSGNRLHLFHRGDPHSLELETSCVNGTERFRSAVGPFRRQDSLFLSGSAVG